VSLSLYEEGVALVRLCNARLDNAEQRVKIISFTENGEVIENDMTGGVTDAVH
ncbi:MAG: exodeoxyribonuclease VII small subunit, partial [Clostridia bacterium]|nr:exodeoxyribonuclease VII small subunit [Clostridia bacterium]